MGLYAASPEAEYELLSKILDDFHKIWGNIPWADEDNVKAQIERIPDMLLKNEAYRNATLNANKQSAHIESSKALNTAMIDLMKNSLELYKQWTDNPSFESWLDDSMFKMTYTPPLHKAAI
jgi:type I restriction enzyme R subunit